MTQEEYKLITSVPVLSFSNLRLDQFPLLEGLFSSNRNALEAINERYSLLSDENYPNFHSCVIYDIRSDDIKHAPGYIKIFYNRFVDKFGKDTVDLIVQDDEHIKRKILNIINFAMNDIYKTDKIRIELWRITSGESTITKLISDVIKENFIVTENGVVGNTNKVFISIERSTSNNK